MNETVLFSCVSKSSFVFLASINKAVFEWGPAYESAFLVVILPASHRHMTSCCYPLVTYHPWLRPLQPACTLFFPPLVNRLLLWWLDSRYLNSSTLSTSMFSMFTFPSMFVSFPHCFYRLSFFLQHILHPLQVLFHLFPVYLNIRLLPELSRPSSQVPPLVGNTASHQQLSALVAYPVSDGYGMMHRVTPLANDRQI